MSQYWIVARVKARSESWAIENVLRQGLGYYLPKIAAGSIVKDGKVIKRTQYLFPSYIFIHTDGRWRCLTGTFGIYGVVIVGDAPAVMPDAAIAQLKSMEKDGLVQLPGMVKDEDVRRPRFKKGDAVRVTAGPFKYMQGIYEGSSALERERILLSIFGRQTQVLIDRSMLEAA